MKRKPIWLNVEAKTETVNWKENKRERVREREKKYLSKVDIIGVKEKSTQLGA